MRPAQFTEFRGGSQPFLAPAFLAAIAIHLAAAGALQAWQHWAGTPHGPVRIVRYAELIAAPIESIAPPRVSTSSDRARPLRPVTPAAVPPSRPSRPLAGPSGEGEDYLAALAADAAARLGEWDGAPTGVLLEPVVVECVKPAYPALARAASIQGDVDILALVGELGLVETARVSRADHAELAGAALEAIYRWRFRPALEGDHARAVWILVPFHFSLSDTATPGLASAL
jgi:TonB family protein